jgi:hypothetical protein
MGSAYGTPQQVALRCRIVLAAADGQSDNSIAQQLAINRKTVMLWRPALPSGFCRVCGRLLPVEGGKPLMAWRKSNKSSTPPCSPNPRPNSVELPLLGQAHGDQQVDGEQHLAEP